MTIYDLRLNNNDYKVICGRLIYYSVMHITIATTKQNPKAYKVHGIYYQYNFSYTNSHKKN